MTLNNTLNVGWAELAKPNMRFLRAAYCWASQAQPNLRLYRKLVKYDMTAVGKDS